jgi:hypothetical protein
LTTRLNFRPVSFWPLHRATELYGLRCHRVRRGGSLPVVACIAMPFGQSTVLLAALRCDHRCATEPFAPGERHRRRWPTALVRRRKKPQTRAAEVPRRRLCGAPSIRCLREDSARSSALRRIALSQSCGLQRLFSARPSQSAPRRCRNCRRRIVPLVAVPSSGLLLSQRAGSLGRISRSAEETSTVVHEERGASVGTTPRDPGPLRWPGRRRRHRRVGLWRLRIVGHASVLSASRRIHGGPPPPGCRGDDWL